MKKIFLFNLFIQLYFYSFSQGIGMGTTSPDPSAALDVSSEEKGILIPRMTSAQRSAIQSAATGLLVYDISSQSFWFKNPTTWVELIDSVYSEVHRSSPDQIYMALDDKVGIGTMDPGTKLSVQTINNAKGISLTDGNVEVATFISNEHTGRWGTTGNHAFNLYANNQPDQFKLLHNGNVGINTAAPQHRLHLTGMSRFNGMAGIGTNPVNFVDVLAGNVRAGSHPSNRPLYVTGDITASEGIEFRHSNGTQGIGVGFNTLYAAGSHESQNLGLSARGESGDLFFTTNATERFRIKANGNVGIGTATPAQRLSIAGGLFVSDGLGIGVANPDAYLQFPNVHASRKMVLYETVNNDHQFLGFGTGPQRLEYHVGTTGNDHVFYGATSAVSSAELMRIKGNGMAGIGIGPVSKLDVHWGAPRGISHGYGRPLYVTGDIDSDAGMEIRHSNGLEGIGFGYNTIYATGSHASQYLQLQSKGTTGALNFITNENTAMSITSEGNVVINHSLEIGHIIVTGGALLTATCECPPGTFVIGGGYSDAGYSIMASYPSSATSWTTTRADGLVQCYAICARIGY